MAIAGRGYPNRPIVTRGALQDDPVLTTKPPIIVLAVQPRVLLRDSLVGCSIIERGSLVDDPQLTTRPPIVVAAWQRASSGTAVVLAAAAGPISAPPDLPEIVLRPRVAC